MPVIKSDKTQAVIDIPPAFRKRCVVRIQEAKFGPNSKGNPMITINKMELCGYFDDKNVLKQEIEKDGTVYKLAGQFLDMEFFTLTATAIRYWEDFWSLTHGGKECPGTDDSNPDIGFLKGLLMEAIVKTNKREEMEQLTDKEKMKLAAENKPTTKKLLGSDGKAIIKLSLKVEEWQKVYTGKVDPF